MEVPPAIQMMKPAPQLETQPEILPEYQPTEYRTELASHLQTRYSTLRTLEVN